MAQSGYYWLAEGWKFLTAGELAQEQYTAQVLAEQKAVASECEMVGVLVVPLELLTVLVLAHVLDAWWVDLSAVQ